MVSTILQMAVYGLLYCPIGLAWFGILGHPLMTGTIVAFIFGASVALLYQFHCAVEAKRRVMALEQLVGRELPDEDYVREWELGKTFASASVTIYTRVGLLFSMVSLAIWAVVVIVRSISTL